MTVDRAYRNIDRPSPRDRHPGRQDRLSKSGFQLMSHVACVVWTTFVLDAALSCTLSERPATHEPGGPIELFDGRRHPGNARAPGEAGAVRAPPRVARREARAAARPHARAPYRDVDRRERGIPHRSRDAVRRTASPLHPTPGCDDLRRRGTRWPEEILGLLAADGRLCTVLRAVSRGAQRQGNTRHPHRPEGSLGAVSTRGDSAQHVGFSWPR